jgi:4-alpha-glucanotransferase
MNLPGTTGNNWSWRMPATTMSDKGLISRIKEANFLYYRMAGMVKEGTPLQGHI